VNDLFEGELTDQRKLVYVNNVIKGKLLVSETLRQQATIPLETAKSSHFFLHFPFSTSCQD